MAKGIELNGSGIRQKPGPKSKPANLRSANRTISLKPFHRWALQKITEQDHIWGYSEAVQKAIEECAASRGITHDEFRREANKKESQ